MLVRRGFDVTGICSDGPWLEKVRAQGIKVIVVPMERGFALATDLKCVWKLYRIFKRERFDLIHYSTPKAALLAGLAGRALGCPALLCTLRGLGYAAFGGWKRLVGKLCEKVACRCAHHVIAISHSLKEQAVGEGLLTANRINVLGAGSSKGVNLDVFRLNAQTNTAAQRIRRDLGICDSDIVIGYAGRMTEEKGTGELFGAVEGLKRQYSGLHLLMIGHTDQRNPLTKRSLELLSQNEYVHLIPFKDNVADYMAAMDILVLPSYREGFGNSLIEASALQIPVVATDIPGCRDAVIDGITGILVKPRDVSSLQRALEVLIEKPEKRIVMGKNGRRWVQNNFDRQVVWERLMLVYKQMLGNSVEPGHK